VTTTARRQVPLNDLASGDVIVIQDGAGNVAQGPAHLNYATRAWEVVAFGVAIPVARLRADTTTAVPGVRVVGHQPTLELS
jgi:hypothetical protein